MNNNKRLTNKVEKLLAVRPRTIPELCNLINRDSHYGTTVHILNNVLGKFPQFVKLGVVKHHRRDHNPADPVVLWDLDIQ